MSPTRAGQVAQKPDLELPLLRQHFLLKTHLAIFQTETEIGLSLANLCFQFRLQHFDAAQQFVDFRIHAGLRLGA